MNLKKRYWTVLLAAFCIVILLTGLWFAAQFKDQKRQIKDNLLAVATLKQLQIDQWRVERLADAALITESPFFRTAIGVWSANTGQAPAGHLQGRLNALARHYKFEAVLLVSIDGTIGFSIGENVAPVTATEKAMFAACVQQRAPLLGESLDGVADGTKEHLFVVAPIFEPEQENGELLAYLLIRIDPNQYIFPVLQTWPKAYGSAEVLLGRRAEDAVLLMNIPSREGDSPVERRIVTEDPSYTVCQQAATGMAGILEGVDYRGVAVLAAAQGIPDSDWFILVKVDASEVLQHLYLQIVFSVVCLLGSLALLTMIGFALYVRDARRDISARVQAQEQVLLQSAALNAAANAIVITDALGTIEWVNEAFSALTGYTSGEAIGKNPSELVKSGVHPEEFYASLWETIMSGKVWTGELTNRRKNGSLYREEQTITPLLDEHGEIRHHIAIKQDITAKRELEEQYLQAQKMESVGRLAGGIAHDFNNLLTVIRGYAEMALAQLDPEDEAAHDMAEVLRAGDRAVGLTRQLLTFSRRQSIEPEILNLNTALEALPRMLKYLIGENIELTWKPGTDLWHVMMDRAQLEQIVVNLVVNARDAIADVGRVTIETENVTIDEGACTGNDGRQPGDYIRLSVEDTGMGMSEEVMSSIFEPFFTTKERGKGTGLGLAMVYGIVKQNNGFIRVDSELGMGTAIHIFLPRHAKSETTAEMLTDSVLDFSGNETVLVVEDSLPLLRLAKITLERLGYRVLSSSDPVEAVELVTNYPESIDLLIADVIMPRMNGLELSQRLLSMRPELKVLFMSGYTADVISKHGILDDGINLLKKPFTSLSLAEKLRAVLDNSGPQSVGEAGQRVSAAVAPLE